MVNSLSGRFLILTTMSVLRGFERIGWLVDPRARTTRAQVLGPELVVDIFWLVVHASAGPQLKDALRHVPESLPERSRPSGLQLRELAAQRRETARATKEQVGVGHGVELLELLDDARCPAQRAQQATRRHLERYI